MLAPDGHQLTLGESLTVKGRASVKCINKGTHFVIELSGLIANGVYGVYSIWDIRLDQDSNVIGVGSLGRDDGSQNHFQATASGDGEVSVIMAGGPLSTFGDAEDCQLDESQLILFVAYHLDGQTHGPVPGPIPGCTFFKPQVTTDHHTAKQNNERDRTKRFARRFAIPLTF